MRALGDFSFGLGDGAVEGKARRRNSTLTLGWVVVASALGGALLAGLLRRNPEGGPVTRLSIGVPTGHLMPVGQNKSLAISHDGRTVAYVTDGLLRVRSLGDSEAMQVPGTGDAYSLFFSPDDTWIGFSDGDGTRKVEIASGAVVNIEGAAPADYGSAWGPDDQIVLSPSLGQSGLWRVPAEGGGMQQVTTVSDVDLETAHVWPQVLPDGRGILFTVLGPSGGWDDGRIAVLEAGETQHTVVLERATSAHYAPSGHLIYALASGTIMAQPFDLDALQADGPAVPVLDGVRVGTFGGGASLAVSDGGTIAYVSGTTETEHILLARSRRGGLRQLGEPLQGAWLDVPHRLRWHSVIAIRAERGHACAARE